MDLQMTQVLDDEKATDDSNTETQVGILRVGSTEHSIVKGFTKIGRHPALCNVVVNDPTVSKVHAEIQASCETAFISDVRSANGTKIKDLPLKPFFYYTINDGDAIYLGTVKAIFTTKKSSERRAVILPETPIPSRRLSEKNTPGIGNNSDCLFNNSSVCQSDDSVVPGTQQKEKRTPIFQEPPIPNDRRKSSNRISISATVPLASEESGENDKAKKSEDAVDATNLHDLETQPFDHRSFICQSRTSKKLNLEKLEQDIDDAIIYDAETQVLQLATETNGTADAGSNKKSRKTDTIGSFNRGNNSSSNFSKELQISSSPSPPDSPNPMDHFADMNQSQNLLELCEAPLLEYEKKANTVENSRKSNEGETAVKRDTCDLKKNSKVSPITTEESVDSRKPVSSSHVIAESDDESVTDDDMDIGIMETPPSGTKVDILASSTSDVIEYDRTTDDEGKVENFASRSRPIAKRTFSLKLRRETTENREAETNIFEAATQRMDEKPPDVASLKKCHDLPREIQYDTDIDLLPTQVLDVATSTPVSRSRKWNTQQLKKIARLGTEDDIHLAPTQIMTDEDDIAGRNARERSDGASPSLGDGNAVKENDNRVVNLDETLMRNLGKILDEEANNRELEDEETQLMTQNLVDILKPTQSFEETESRVLDEEIVDDIREPRSPKRKKISPPETLGFVNGEAAAGNRRSKTVPMATSTIRDDRNEDEKEIQVAISEPRESECVDEDDILVGLPEVKIYGTLSNPGSPSLSTTSSHSDFEVSGLRETGKSEKTKKTVASRSTENPSKTIEAAKSLELDSPVGKKSRVARKEAPRNVIEDDDQDSDEAFGYNDLKKMADSLLASDSVDSTRSRNKDIDVAVDEVETFSSTRRRMRHVRNASNKDADSSRRTRKLPQSPSSALVTDLKSKQTASGSASTIDKSSLAEVSRDSSRIPKSTKLESSRSKIASKRGKESQEVQTTLAATPVISKKSYAKVQLMRLDDNDVGQMSNNADNLESPKVNRKRRATMSAKDVTPVPASPASIKSRRTIAEGIETRVSPKEQHKILITGLQEDYSKIVKKLGGSVVSEPSKATVLITDKVRRTYKFLCAVARGLRVVSINWLLESKQAARFLDCDDFILNDPAAEKQYGFKLEKSLKAARMKKFLEGYTIVVTPKVNQPEIHELKDMIEACGGRVLTRAPGVRAWNSKTLIISREEDLTAINALVSKCPKSLKITVQSTEFVLTGILRQEVNLVEHKLNIP